jgi:hypothetical protein
MDDEIRFRYAGRGLGEAFRAGFEQELVGWHDQVQRLWSPPYRDMRFRARLARYVSGVGRALRNW